MDCFSEAKHFIRLHLKNVLKKDALQWKHCSALRRSVGSVWFSVYIVKSVYLQSRKIFFNAQDCNILVVGVFFNLDIFSF